MGLAGTFVFSCTDGWFTGRNLLGLTGSGLCFRGLKREAPTACVLGTQSLALMIEEASNLGIDDIQCMVSTMTRKVSESLHHDRPQAIREQAAEAIGGHG